MDEEAEYVVPSDEEERREAREAGERALKSLREARGYLAKASSWGLVDLFGGNFISGALKHARLAEARHDTTHWSVVGRVQDYQILDPDLADADQPYSILPQVTAIGRWRNFAPGLRRRCRSGGRGCRARPA